jgi:hypothetical protein
MATVSVRRLVHVPTIVSLGMLEEAQSGAKAADQLSLTRGAARATEQQPATPTPVDLPIATDQLPLQQAVGMARLPLYHFVPSNRPQPLASSPSAMSLATDAAVEDDEEDAFGSLVPGFCSRCGAAAL